MSDAELTSWRLVLVSSVFPAILGFFPLSESEQSYSNTGLGFIGLAASPAGFWSCVFARFVVPAYTAIPIISIAARIIIIFELNGLLFFNFRATPRFFFQWYINFTCLHWTLDMRGKPI